jgi:hypothetical protein
MPSAAVFPSVISAATFTVIAATFTIITAIITITTAVYVSAILTATAATSVSSASASNRLPHSVNSVKPWSYYPMAPFPQPVTSI